MPHASNCDSSIAWSWVSRAFDKSRNIPAKFFSQFLASKVLVLRRNEPASLRTPRHPTFNCNENHLDDNIFKISDFPVTCSRAVCHLGITVIIYIWKSIYYQIDGIICPCFVRGRIRLFFAHHRTLALLRTLGFDWQAIPTGKAICFCTVWSNHQWSVIR